MIGMRPMRWLKVLFPFGAVKEGISLALQTFDQTLQNGGYKSLLMVLLGLFVFWHLYVPLHELLHVAGCLLAGGEVTSLALKPQYGGSILNKVFPFIVPESEYAGRLTGFSTPTPWALALVDFFPYIISLPGITLVGYCRRKKAPFLLGAGFILTFVPFMSVPGDYYEAVSLVTARVAEVLDPRIIRGELVSDDVFRSIRELGDAGKLDWTIGTLIFIGVVLAAYLAFMTLALQVWISRRFTLETESQTDVKKKRK